MKRLSKGKGIYFIMILAMFIGKFIWIFFELDDPLVQRFSNSWAVMFGVSILGYACIGASGDIGFAKVWDDGISNRKKIIIPSVVGIAFALVQIILVVFQGVEIPMVPFPISIPVYFSVGILSELMLHFIPLVFGVWILSHVIFKDRWRNYIFWVVAVFISSLEPMLQFIMMSQMNILPGAAALIVLSAIIFAANLVPIVFIKRYGLIAAVVWRLSNYLLWHVVWGGFF